jgi:glycosyltransferase involved in cell wall biosynthesis
MDLQKIPWGTSGPSLIKKAVDKFGLQKYIQSPKVFCPVDGWDVEKFINPEVVLTIPDETHAIHLWNTMWLARHMDKSTFPVGSPYYNLKNSVRMDSPYLGDVTAVIKTMLRDESLFHCVKTLKEQYPSIHIIVADDGYCSKEKGDKLKSMGIDKYIEMPWNRGLSEGRNVLLDACQTPYLLLCDDDFGFTKESHVDRLRDLMDVADIAAGLVYNVKAYTFSTEQGKGWDTFGGFFLHQDGKLYLTDFKGDIKRHKNIRYEEADLVLNFFVGKVKELKKVRWDNELCQAYEHQDFFLRAKKLGLKSVRSLDSHVLHKELDDTNNSSYMKIRADYLKYLEIFEEKWGFSCLNILPGMNPKPIMIKPPIKSVTIKKSSETVFSDRSADSEFDSILNKVSA